MSPQKLATSHPSDLRQLRHADGEFPRGHAPASVLGGSLRSKPRHPFVNPVEIPPANPHIHSIDYTSVPETPFWRFGAVLVGNATSGGGYRTGRATVS